MSPQVRFLVAAASLALLVPAAAVAKKAKTRVKAKVDLAADAALVVDVDTSLIDVCNQWPCLLDVNLLKAEEITVAGADGPVVVHAFAGKDKTGTALRYVVSTDGSWELRYTPEKTEDDEEAEGEAGADQGKGKDADPQIEPETGTPPEGPDRIADVPTQSAEGTATATTSSDEGDAEAGDDDDSANWEDKPVKTDEEWVTEWWEGQVGKDSIVIATGTLAGDGPLKTLTIDAANLPTSSFQLAVNGYWGARVGEHVVGSPAKTGVVQINR